ISPTGGAFARSGSCSLAMVSALVKLPDEDLFDPANLCGDVGRRQTGDLSDRCRVLFLEVEEHHLSIERTQTLNQRVEPVERATTIDAVLAIDDLRHCIEVLVHRDQRRRG